MAIIPFYGVDYPDLFALERAAMDRPGLVIERLDRLLPSGTIADIGAGDGFTAERLLNPSRRIVAVEPARGMIDTDRHLTWVQADAERLPFRDGALDAAYATWAYFFSRGPLDPLPGIRELHRAVKPGGPLVIADNAGDDEFCALAPHDISADSVFWRSHRFGVEIRYGVRVRNRHRRLATPRLLLRRRWIGAADRVRLPRCPVHRGEPGGLNVFAPP